MDPGRARGGDRVSRARVQEAVLADERAVEVARERVDPLREIRGKVYGVVPPGALPVDLTTKVATSAICWSVS